MKRRRFLLQTLAASGALLITRKSYSWLNNSIPMTNKSIDQRHQLKFKQAFPGLRGVDIMAHAYPIEPFLVFTEFYMDNQVFGPHPHAGISVMTYMLPDSTGSFLNRDSQGDFSTIEPGGVHIMQAGSGMHHDEFPSIKGVETHGFQIWINHADKDRLVTPKSMHANAKDVPVQSSDAYTVRVIHGDFQGVSPNYAMVTSVQLYHVFLKPHGSITLDALPMAFLYGLKGKGETEGQGVEGQTLINFSKEGNSVVVVALEEGLEFMFATGTPHNETITYGGPFVMTTPEQMAETQRRYANGEMGKLDPYTY